MLNYCCDKCHSYLGQWVVVTRILDSCCNHPSQSAVVCGQLQQDLFSCHYDKSVLIKVARLQNINKIYILFLLEIMCNKKEIFFLEKLWAFLSNKDWKWQPWLKIQRIWKRITSDNLIFLAKKELETCYL